MTVVTCVKCSVLVVPDAEGKCSTCHSDLSNAAQTNACPSRQQLGEYLHDKLSSVIAEAIECHFEECDHCEDVLDALPKAEELHSMQRRTLEVGRDQQPSKHPAALDDEKRRKVSSAPDVVESLTRMILHDCYVRRCGAEAYMRSWFVV